MAHVMGTGRRSLVTQIKRRSAHEADRHATTLRGVVTRKKPLTIQVFGWDQPLNHDEGDFELGQWGELYQKQVGFKKDDVVVMHRDDEWVLIDVVTDAPLGKLVAGGKGKKGKDGSSGGAFYPTRKHVKNTFHNLTPGVETLVKWSTPGQAHTLFSVEVDKPCRVRIHATHAQAIADRTRSEYYDPGVDVGCLLELVYITGLKQLILSPTATLVEQDQPYGHTFSGVVRLDAGTTPSSLTVTLDGYPIQP